jgi:hypothetical protein
MMKYSAIFAPLTALVAAQSLPVIPTCSKLCLNDAFPRANCTSNDFKCVCTKADEVDKLITPCLEATCSKHDEAEFREVAWRFCGTIGKSTTGLQGEMAREVANQQGAIA